MVMRAMRILMARAGMISPKYEFAGCLASLMVYVNLDVTRDNCFSIINKNATSCKEHMWNVFKF